MTPNQMHALVQLRLQEVGAYRYEDFLPEEVDVYLNLAQIALVKRLASAENPRLSDDLRTLVREQPILPVIDKTILPNGSPHEYAVPFPDDFLYYLGGEAGVTRTALPVIETKEYVGIVLGDETDVPALRVTTFNRPYLKRPIAVMREDFLHVFCDEETTVHDHKLVYLRLPATIKLDETDDYLNTHSDLPEHLHDEIVNGAVALMMSDTTPRGGTA